MKRSPLSLLLLTVMLLLSSQLPAQDKILNIDDYNRWSHIVGVELSNNGNWMAYGLRPNGGDDTLHVVSLVNDTQYTIPLGEGAVFSNKNSWVAYTITVDEENRKKIQQKGDQIFEKAELLNLSSGKNIP